jgi:gluconate 2-dehydrogenase gamma chain
MTRRELIHRTTLALGYTLSSSTLMGILNGCQAKPDINFAPIFFTPEQAAIVSDLAETILPKTQTPGAKDVGVPTFIDRFVKEIYSKTDQEKFLADLEAFNQDCAKSQSKKFSECDVAQQKLYASQVHQQAVANVGSVSEGWWNTAKAERPFIMKMKELTLLGFFTSQQGATEVLQYNQSPGPYQGCVPLKEVGKAWAT